MTEIGVGTTPKPDRGRTAGPPRSVKDHASFGTHREFADLYEKFLDAVYDSTAEAAPGSGRWLLIRQVANEIRHRGARRVLDCAAGSGFPGLDLAAMAGDYGIETVHCTDGDPEMIRILRRRARSVGASLAELTPKRSSRLEPGDGHSTDPLVLDWAELNRIHESYDYVLCRGNSLAYADTWTGSQTVASAGTIRQHVTQIATKVAPGGFLHVDAPWEATLKPRKYRAVASGAVSIWEQVETGADFRHWRIDVKLPSGQTFKFERYSSLLTIHHLADALEDLGFEQTEPFAMAGERSNYGVIIARRPPGRRGGQRRNVGPL